MCIFQRNTFNVVAKSIASGIRIFNAFVPTALPMDYADEAADTAPLIRHSQTQALDTFDSEVQIEPQSSGYEHSSSDDSSGAQTLIVSSSEDDTEVQSSIQSSSEQPSNAPTPLVSPSDGDTEVQSSIQSSKEGNQSIASRTRLQLARQRLSTTALPTEPSPLEQQPQTPITHTDPHDPLPTAQLTNDNSLTCLQDRQRAPLKHSRRSWENYTGNDSSMSETLDEEVNYGSFDIDAIPHTDSDHAWSTHENDSQD
jgi:hypothetical protein